MIHVHPSQEPAQESPRSIVEAVNSKYKLPFLPYPFQTAVINHAAPFVNTGIYMEVGTGKTIVGTILALNRKLQNPTHQEIVLMPPILLQQWRRWLVEIKGVSCTIYRGTTKQRKEIDLDSDFVLMSIQIFKKDYNKLQNYFQDKHVGLTVDEATSIKNSTSKNYLTVKSFQLCIAKSVTLMTGTPLSSPLDGFAYIKLISPKTYASLSQFEMYHVGMRDIRNRVTKWNNLNTLRSNLLLNSVRVIKEEVLTDMPAIVYQPIYYDLDPEHLAVYRELMENQFLLLEDGGKIDGTTPSRMFHASQQIVMNYSHFSQDETKFSAGFALLDQILEELDGKKLIIFANYKMTIKSLMKHLAAHGHQAVSVFGENQSHHQRNVDAFLTDPNCRNIVIQPQSGGLGLNLQSICADILFLELPLTPRDFHQAVGRVYRNGQQRKVHVRIACAEKTIQVKLQKKLMEKDALVNKVQLSYRDLRDYVFGE